MSGVYLDQHETLMAIGDTNVDWPAITAHHADPAFDGARCNVGPTDLLAAAWITTRAGRNRRSLAQLTAFDFPNHGWLWFYLPRRTAVVMAALAAAPRTSYWTMENLGSDCRSQVAQARYVGVNIATVDISAGLEDDDEDADDENPQAMWHIMRPIRFGADVFTVRPRPYAEMLPPLSTMLDLRAVHVRRTLAKRLAAADRVVEDLEQRPPALVPLHSPDD